MENAGEMKPNLNFTLACPISIQQYPQVLLAHGGGGRLMHQLIEQLFIPAFGNATLNARQDAATIALNGQNLAFTTDSYVVRPLFFPGGNIGTLAVNGTVNDLAMVGARPLYLSVGFILEEGLPMQTLWDIVRSMQQAAEIANVHIITGDTKVVDRGKGDGVFINTAGIGVIEHTQTIAPQKVQPGDVVLLNGDLGRHGIAIMAVREGLEFETTIASDSAPLAEVVLNLLEAGIEIHCLRDLTRGGLASALNEIAAAADVEIAIVETQIPIHPEVQGACEILGLDPLYVANEGRFVAFVPEKEAERTLSVLQAYNSKRADSSTVNNQACMIGHVTENSSGIVKITSRIGVQRIMEMLSGEQLPRIC